MTRDQIKPGVRFKYVKGRNIGTLVTQERDTDFWDVRWDLPRTRDAHPTQTTVCLCTGCIKELEIVYVSNHDRAREMMDGQTWHRD